MLLSQINNDLIFGASNVAESGLKREKREEIRGRRKWNRRGRDGPGRRSAAWRIGVDILTHFVDLAAQIATFIRRQTADATVHLGVAAGLLHRAALLFGTGLVVVALVDLALLVGLARIGLALDLHLLRTVFFTARPIAGLGMGKPHPQQTATQQ